MREQINKIKSSPFFPNVPIHGYVYDVKTGKISNGVQINIDKTLSKTMKTFLLYQ